MHLTIGIAPLLVIAGGLVFQTFQAVFIARSPIRPPSASWWLAFVVGALMFVVARTVQRGALEPVVAYAAGRAQFAICLAFPMIGLGAIEAQLYHRRPSRPWRLIAGAAAVVAILVLTTNWIVRPHPEARLDLHGDTFYGTELGPAGAIMSALWVAMAALAVVRVRAMVHSTSAVRWQIRTMALLFIVTGVNDSLLVAGVIRSVHLFEYALLFPSALSAAHLLRTSEDTNADLTIAVAARTADLERASADLAHALDEQRASERRFRQLADSSREGVVVLDGEVAIDTNRALRAMFGREPEAAPALDLATLFGPDEIGAVRQLLVGGRDRIVTVSGRRADGTSFPVEVSAPPAEAATSARVLLIRDVTVQQELQRQVLRSDRLAAMGTLAAATAHEINNPLTYVLSNAEILVGELSAPVPADAVDQLRELAGDVVSGAERIRVIVRDMVAVARDAAPVETAVDVGEVLRESLAMVAHQLRHRATIEVAIEAVPAIRGDRVRLGQVFVNLLINASQAIPAGHADRHRVRIEARPAGPEYLVVRISDTGVGMTPAVRDRIFDPFFTTKDVGEGTGLGLAVSLGIVTALGGRIEVESELGVGSTFTVRLPVAQALPTPLAASSREAPTTTATPATPSPIAPPSAVARRKILIVDDEPLVAKSLARVLSAYDTTIVDSGRAALDVCAGEDFAAIICDLMMPDVTGIEVHAALTETAPALAERMVFVTGGAFTDRARAFLASVPNRRLPKPVPTDELRLAIAAVTAAPGKP